MLGPKDMPAVCAQTKAPGPPMCIFRLGIEPEHTHLGIGGRQGGKAKAFPPFSGIERGRKVLGK